MNTCPDCKNDLVCHDQGECLRPTPETDSAFEEFRETCDLSNLEKEMANIERERNEAREQLASEKATRNAIIAKGIETERQLAEARAICEELVTDSNAVTLAATVVRLERQLAEARQAFAIATDQLVQVQGELRQAREENARLREALQRISDCTDAPHIDPVGEIRCGLHCGVEDHDCTDRYDGADYGFACGTERALEWASNEALHALNTLTT